jgi:hypothetical protein
VFPTETPGSFEYRVIDAQAIENCEDSDFGDHVLDCTRLCYYGKAKPFYSEEEAVKEALRMEKEIMESDFPVLEYGISTIEYDRPLLKMSVEEARKKLDDHWKQFQKEKEAEQAKREAETKQGYVLMPVPYSEYQGEIYGVRVDLIQKLREKHGEYKTEEEALDALDRLHKF